MEQDHSPLVTAIIPVYNHEKYVVESIQSIIAQTYPNIELIVINDGSRDRSHEAILSVVDECKRRFPRFEYINQENKGLAATLNQALPWAKGRYFSVMASDDVALPEKFFLLVEALESRGESFAAAFGNALFIDERSERISLNKDGLTASPEDSRCYRTFLDFYLKDRDFDFRSPEFGTYKSLLVGNYLPAMSSLVRVSAIREMGGWTASSLLEDWEMWLALSKKYRLAYLGEPVALYRWHALNSVKTAHGKLLCATLALLSREKAFCYRNELNAVWRERYASTTLDVFKDTSLPRMRKLSSLEIKNLCSMIAWSVSRLFAILSRHRRRRALA